VDDLFFLTRLSRPLFKKKKKNDYTVS
jgi:hypothetical protein